MEEGIPVDVQARILSDETKAAVNSAIMSQDSGGKGILHLPSNDFAGLSRAVVPFSGTNVSAPIRSYGVRVGTGIGRSSTRGLAALARIRGLVQMGARRGRPPKHKGPYAISN